MVNLALNKLYTNFISIGILVLISTLVFLPSLSHGAEGLVPCGTTGGQPCGFSDLVVLFQRVMNFLLWRVMVPLATLSIAFVGVQFITATGNPGKLDKAKTILWDVLFGIFIALAAWLIINTIFTVLTGSGLPSVTG